MSNSTKVSYAKPWLSLDEQIDKLRQRGLIIRDADAARRFIAYANYYRFTGYGLHFQRFDAATGKHTYHPGTAYEDIERLCILDRRLRDAFSEALELIELSLRSCIAYHFSAAFGPFGHTSEKNFMSAFGTRRQGSSGKSDFDEWLEKIHLETKRSKELFVFHFKQKYAEYPDLPLWSVAELCSFGSLSKMVSEMRKPELKPIAAQYGLQPLDFTSWLHHLTYLRNVCAHHARLWDKKFAIKPTLPAGRKWDSVRQTPDAVFTGVLVLNWMLAHDSIDATAHALWKAEIVKTANEIFAAYPAFQSVMKFPDKWEEHPVWLL